MSGMVNEHIAVIGVGNIGKMLLERLRAMGVPANRISVCDTDPKRLEMTASETGANVFNFADLSGCEATVWLLCTGPKTIIPVLKNLAPHMKPGHLVVSFAAGVPLARLEALVPEGVSVVRVMPNMPSLIGLGMNPVCFSKKTRPEARGLVLELLEDLGRTIEVRDDQMNWCVGLSGAAMRSILPVIEGMIRAGMDAGLNEADARLIAAQVVMGTAGLVKDTFLSLAEIKNLTPMETLDESVMARLVYNAAVGAKEKIDGLQKKIEAE